MKVSDIIEGIRQHIDLQNLADYLTDSVYRLCRSPSSLLLWDSKRKCFLLRSKHGVNIQEDCIISREGAIVQWFSSKHSDFLVCDKVLDKESHPMSDDLRQELQQLQAQVCLALRSDDGEILGFLNVEKKKDGGACSEEELNLLREIVKQAASTIERIKIYTQIIEERVFANLGKIAVQIAHDLNSPLSNINMFLHLLAQDTGWKNGVSPDLSHKFFTIAQKEIVRATAITKNLLMYARPGRSKAEQIAVNQLMDNVLEITDAQIRRHAIRIIRHYHTEEIVIPGEREQLTRVFVNLVQNAIDAMAKEESRELTIGTAYEEQMVVVSIKDTGRGIPDEIKADLFIPFVTSDHRNCLGLGLSIIERFVALHGGDIEAKANFEQGTCFMVRLPLEKRGSQRRLAAFIETYRVPQNELMVTQDISATGLRLGSGEYIPLNQQLRLFINLPDNLPPIPVAGKVVWIKEALDRKGPPYNLGLEFLDIGVENRKRITRLINSLEKNCPTPVNRT